MIYLNDNWSYLLLENEMPIFDKKSLKFNWVTRPKKIDGVIFTSKDVQNIGKSAEITFAETIMKYNFIVIANNDGENYYSVLR